MPVGVFFEEVSGTAEERLLALDIVRELAGRAAGANKENSNASITAYGRHRGPRSRGERRCRRGSDPDCEAYARFQHPGPAVAIRTGSRGRLFCPRRRERAGRSRLWVCRRDTKVASGAYEMAFAD